jgi:hypothetical protein
MSDNEPDGIENATHNTFAKLCNVNFDINVIRLVNTLATTGVFEKCPHKLRHFLFVYIHL